MTSCSQAEVVTQWAKQGADAPLDLDTERHVESCPTCHELLHDVLAARRLAAGLPIHELAPAKRDEFRFTLMAEARKRAGRRLSSWPRANGARRLRHPALLVAAVLLLLVGGIAAFQAIRTTPSAFASAANVVLLAGAHGTIESSGPDELYRLSRGTADFTVNKLAKDHRYRVLAGDGTVEVRGTRFRLEVTNEQLQAVEVTEGRVWVWLGGNLIADLGQGQRWARPEAQAKSSPEPGKAAAAASPPPTASVVAHAEPVAPSPAVVSAERTLGATSAARAPSSTLPAPAPAPSPSSEASGSAAPDDAAFARAWQFFKQGEPLRAAHEFDAMAASGTLDPGRHADVLYWAAQAYSRAGSPANAELRARRLAEDYPRSFRAADAALMLGEMTLARGQRDEARRWLERAARSTHPSVRARAEKRLSELDSTP